MGNNISTYSTSSSTLENGIEHIRFGFTVVPIGSTENIKFDPQNRLHITLVSLIISNRNINLPSFCQGIVDEIRESLNLVTDLEDEKDYYVDENHKQCPVEISCRNFWTSKTLIMASLELDDDTIEFMNELSKKIVKKFEESKYIMLGENRTNPNYSWVLDYPEDVQKVKFSWLEKIGDANFLGKEKHVTCHYNIDPMKTLQENCIDLGFTPGTKYVLAINGLGVSKTDVLGRLDPYYLYEQELKK
jgi:hypothetical protein